jgi:hypothetical protein
MRHYITRGYDSVSFHRTGLRSQKGGCLRNAGKGVFLHEPALWYAITQQPNILNFSLLLLLEPLLKK